MNSFNDVFSAVKEYCQEKLAAATYNLFIQDIEPVSFDGKKATLLFHAEFKRSTVAERYTGLLKEAFLTLLGFEVELELRCDEDIINIPVPKTPDTSQKPVTPGNGNYAYTFENFIVGSTNKFAHAAALAVASNPSHSYNPLFIYGDSGLGKTHLLNAIRYEVAKNHPEFHIVYVDGESFTNEIISAIRDSSTVEFHEKYRAADLLLVDDIQFIAGKESTQEEFFHTFNTLHNAEKQIVLASDRPPKEIKSLEDRLRTRFESGLMADIQPPDFETRVAIIRRKAALLGLDIPDDVAEFIANHLKNNIRQLEGTVKKLNAYRLLEGVQPVIGVAQTAIRDILSETQPIPVTIDKILSEVARTYSITTADLRSRKRTSNISNARKVAMFVIREITGLSTLDIGKEFGGRDHSTVVYSLGEVSKNMENDSHLRETVEDIIKNARA